MKRKGIRVSEWTQGTDDLVLRILHPLSPQNKRFTKFAVHKYLILREMFVTEQIRHSPKQAQKEKKREMQSYLSSIIPRG